MTKSVRPDDLHQTQACTVWPAPHAYTPVTPNQTPSSVRIDNDISVLQDQHSPSPNGGIALRSETLTDSFVDLRTTLSPRTPSAAANTRIRRSRHKTVLTQSPARASYASRMRQIFEDASRECGAANHGGTLYPQLPNISRRASPPAHNTNVHMNDAYSKLSDSRLGSLIQSADLPLVEPQFEQPSVTCLTLCKRTSGSWSDDSGYLIAETYRKPGLEASPTARVHAWLSCVAGALQPEDDARLIDREERYINRYGLDSALSMDPFIERMPFCSQKTMAEDPSLYDECHSNANRQSAKKDGPDRFYRQANPQALERDMSENCKQLYYCENTPTAVSGDRSCSTPILQTKPLPKTGEKLDHTVTTSPVSRLGLDDGGIELSPLSPNVCVERGPSRHHSNRKPFNHGSTPTMYKGGIALNPLVSQHKENMALPTVCTPGIGSPLSQRYVVFGSRIQRSYATTTLYEGGSSRRLAEPDVEMG